MKKGPEQSSRLEDWRPYWLGGCNFFKHKVMHFMIIHT